MVLAIRTRLKGAYQRLSHKSSKLLSSQSSPLRIFSLKPKLEPRVEPKVVIKIKPKFEVEIEIPAPDPVKITVPVKVPVQAKVPKRSLKITDLPNDVVLMIFDLLVKHSACKTSATCFGLSNPIFYSILKSYVPMPIRLKDNYEIIRGLPGSTSVLSLSNAITDFMGPEYRVGTFSRKFLARSVYGDVVGPLEIELDRRYHAYEDTMAFVSRGTNDNGMTHYVVRRHVLPNPHGMGDEWYTEAMKVMVDADLAGIRLISYMDHIGGNCGVSWTFVP
ncbi:hypothetical protein BKA64DRAFT_712389 [Cadophora sp. MPI-SDFR-AT-0126]|nr:hypothetical protein BKA64DRAFT_712389 [Leotiomycetes sp. MPI-SDFR-AT-0126]